jgi:glycosyltransferase involved in cell wall biosynthesis
VNQHVYVCLRELGWDVTLIVPERWRHEYGADAFQARALPPLEDRFMPLPVILAGRPQRHVYRRRLGPLIRRLAPRAILLEEETFSLPAAQWAFAASRAGIPFGVQAAENLNRPLPAVARAARSWTLPRASLVTARSPAAAVLASQWGARGTIEVIPHAVPGWGEPAKAPDRPYTIGYAGRLVPEKGVDDLLAAARRLAEPVRVLLVGDGVLRAELESAEMPNGTVEIRTNVGHDEMPLAYAEMDVLVLPSRTTENWTEQFGRVLVEALSCGVPVIGSDSGEIPWVIETTGGGRVFREGDVQSLAAAIDELRSHPDVATKLARAGQASVAETFSVEAVARQLDRALLDVSDDRRGRTDRPKPGAVPA